MSTDDVSSMKKLIMWLRIVIAVTAFAAIFETVLFLFSDEPIAFLLDGEIWSKTVDSFNLSDRLVIFTIISASTICWLTVLYQIWRLCRLYAASMVFTVYNARCFITMSLAMIAMAAVETITIPFIGAYLKQQEVLPQMPDMEAAFMLELDLFAAGLFFWLIAKIMERAALLREEAELTV